jgi:OOP family OmpA-OmpF porin
MKFKIILILILLGFSNISTSFAAGDLQASKDHPLISRYPNTHIVNYTVTDYNDYPLATAPAKEYRDPLTVKEVHGKITTIVYTADSTQDSVVQVYENYRDALQKAGFKMVFQCGTKSCGDHFVPKLIGENPRRDQYHYLYPNEVGSNSDYRLLTASLTHKNQPVYITLVVSKPNYSDKPVVIALDIVEEKNLKLGMVKVTPDALAHSNKGDEPATASENKTVDIKGAKDHPLVSRYPHTHIADYTVTDYDTYALVTAPAKEFRDPLTVKEVHGKITTIVYTADSTQDSVVQVYENYRSALEKAGFKSIFQCANKSCGDSFVQKLMGDSPRRDQYHHLYPNDIGANSDYRLLTASLTHKNQPVYITLVVNKPNYNDKPVVVALDIVEGKNLKLGEVTITPDALANSIQDLGKAVLTGIFFDTDKASLKPQSAKALKVIADYLKANPKNIVYIVGHTDNTGGYEHNLELSRNRAEAVVDTLVKDYSVEKSRLKAVGIGEVSPATSNGGDAGRARNRRVEMVLMGK